MSGQGFDTWILEVRGAGLSVRASNLKEIKETADAVSEQMEAVAKSVTDGVFPQQPPTNVSDSQLSERFEEVRVKLSNLLEKQQNSGIASQIRDLSQRLVNIIEEGQRSVSPQFIDMQERLSSTIEDFQKQLDLIVKYDWDFDHYLEEDVTAAMEYIRAQTKPKDGNLLAIGHSMGGILLYAMLSRCGYEGREPRLKAVVTLASSLDYTSSDSTLKLFLPLADPAQALNVPVVPLGTLLAAAYPLSSRPPYVLAWLNNLISAEDMMHPELLEKLVLNNFCTIPAKLILQLTTAFRERGLCDRSGKFFYKDHVHKSNVTVLAIAGDRDLICPPEAVEETVKLFPQNLVTYKVFGEHQGPHYAHYDLVGGRLFNSPLSTRLTSSLLLTSGCLPEKLSAICTNVGWQNPTKLLLGSLLPSLVLLFFSNSLVYLHVDGSRLANEDKHTAMIDDGENNQMDSNASGFLLNNSALHSVYYQAKEDNGIIDLGLSLRTLQPEAYHPSRHMVRLEGYNDVISWPQPNSQLKSSNTGYSRLAAEECDDEAEGVQSRERWAYVKVNMDGIMVGRKVCMLDLGGYSGLARQLEEMFGSHTTSGLRLFEVESEFSLFYKDKEENWRNVGDVPWREFVERMKRLRISRKNEARLSLFIIIQLI
ncbi:hypothetical protein REPUB_Repub04eG0157000 [Reevesia pubescens]